MHHAFCIGFELNFVYVIKTALITDLGRVKTLNFVCFVLKSPILFLLFVYPSNTKHIEVI